VKVAETGYWIRDESEENFHRYSERLAAWLVGYFKGCENQPLYDLGCGLGKYLEAFHKAGFEKAIGFEGAPLNPLPFITVQDLAQRFEIAEPSNCVCLEVMEHIPAEYTNAAIDNLARGCKGRLVMSWAVPGQGGLGHVNELPNDEAIAKMERAEFLYLPSATLAARVSMGKDDPCHWFANTLLVFRK